VFHRRRKIMQVWNNIRLSKLHWTIEEVKCINYKCNFFTKIIVTCRCIYLPQFWIPRILLNVWSRGEWEWSVTECILKKQKFTSGAYYSETRAWWGKLHLSEQFLSEPISTHSSWIELKCRIWEKCMNKK